MSIPDLNNLNKSELSQVIKKAESLLKKRDKEARKAVLQKMRAIAAENGMTIEEVVGQKTSRTRAPVPPKYRDPSTDQTWTGRGRKPKWVEAALASGKTLPDLAI